MRAGSGEVGGDGLWRAMLATEVRVGGARVVPVGECVSVGAPAADARYVVTAWNPGAKATSETANDVAQGLLVAELDALGVGHEPAEGVALDGSWAEPSLMLHGVTRGEACRIGRRFGQLAVFEWSPASGVLAVVACDGSRAVGRRAELTAAAGSAGACPALEQA